MIFVLGNSKDFNCALSIRIKPDLATREAMQGIEKVFKKYNPGVSLSIKATRINLLMKFVLAICPPVSPPSPYLFPVWVFSGLFLLR
jgi:hypothetical protein